MKSIDSRIPGLSLPAGLLIHVYGIETLLGCAQSFPHLFDFMRFAHFGSDAEQLDDVQEVFQYLVILWIRSYFLLHDWEICQDVKLPDSIWFTQQKRRVQKRLDFSIEEEKPPTVSLCKCIPRYEGVGSKRKFSISLISLQGGSNFTALFSDRERKKHVTEWPGFPEISRGWKRSLPWRNGFLGNKQDWMLENAQFWELENWTFAIFSQCPCLIFSVSTLAKHKYVYIYIYRERVLISGGTDYIP